MGLSKLYSAYGTVSIHATTDADRRAVEAVAELTRESDQPITVAALATHTDRAKSTTHDRVNRLLKKSLLINTSPSKNRIYLGIGDPLPERSSLPTTEELMRSLAPEVKDPEIRIQKDAGHKTEAVLQAVSGNPDAYPEEPTPEEDEGMWNATFRSD